MKKIFHLAVALFSATSLTTSTFAGRGSEEPAPVPVAPIVTPIPQDPTPDAPDINDDDQNNDQNNNPQQGFSAGQVAAAGVGGAAAALALGGAAVYTKKAMEKANKVNNQLNEKEIRKIVVDASVSSEFSKELAFKALDAVSSKKTKTEKKEALVHLEKEHKNAAENSPEKEYIGKLLDAVKGSHLTAGEKIAAGYRGTLETKRVAKERISKEVAARPHEL